MQPQSNQTAPLFGSTQPLQQQQQQQQQQGGGMFGGMQPNNMSFSQLHI
jgi:hypothetical protein